MALKESRKEDILQERWLTQRSQSRRRSSSSRPSVVAQSNRIDHLEGTTACTAEITRIPSLKRHHHVRSIIRVTRFLPVEDIPGSLFSYGVREEHGERRFLVRRHYQQNDARIRAMYKMYHKSCNLSIKAVLEPFVPPSAIPERALQVRAIVLQQPFSHCIPINRFVNHTSIECCSKTPWSFFRNSRRS
jgi:hypothetical protein